MVGWSQCVVENQAEATLDPREPRVTASQATPSGRSRNPLSLASSPEPACQELQQLGHGSSRWIRRALLRAEPVRAGVETVRAYQVQVV